MFSDGSLKRENKVDGWVGWREGVGGGRGGRGY